MAASPVAVRGQYTDLYGSTMLPVLEELFRAEMAMHPSKASLLFATRTTDRDIYQYSELMDLDLFQQVSEGQDYTFKRPKQGANKTIVPLKYGLGFSISDEAVSDGKFDMISEMTRKLARSGTESQAIQEMNIFNNAFGTTTVADTLALCHTAHTLPSGGTFRNRLSTDSDLSVTSFDTALADFEQVFVGDSGIIYHLVPKRLLVHPNSKRYAMELVGSTNKPDTADNNLNPFKNDNIEVVSDPHLTDTDAWFLLADAEETGLRIVKRTEIETKAAGPDVGFMNDSIFYKSRYRRIVDALHAYGVLGTPGA